MRAELVALKDGPLEDLEYDEEIISDFPLDPLENEEGGEELLEIRRRKLEMEYRLLSRGYEGGDVESFGFLRE